MVVRVLFIEWQHRSWAAPTSESWESKDLAPCKAQWSWRSLNNRLTRNLRKGLLSISQKKNSPQLTALAFLQPAMRIQCLLHNPVWGLKLCSKGMSKVWRSFIWMFWGKQRSSRERYLKSIKFLIQKFNSKIRLPKGLLNFNKSIKKIMIVKKWV
jgi:hypothetical protein